MGGLTAATAAGAVAAVVLVLGGSDAPPAGAPGVTRPDAAVLARSTALTRAPAVLPAGRAHPAPQQLSATQLAGAVAELQRELPYPRGFEDRRLARMVHTPVRRGDMTAIATVNDARLLGEFRAWCTWQRYWLAAHDAGDALAQRDAAIVLGQVPRWPTFRSNLTAAASAIAAAARAGDAGTVARFAQPNCR